MKITATSNEPLAANAKAKTVVCTVKVDQAVSSITLDLSEVKIGINGRVKPVATIQPEDATNKKLTWTSDDPKVASVSNNGEIRGVSVGSTVVRCEAADGNGAVSELRVTVFQPVQSLKLDKNQITAYVGRMSEALKVSLNPENAEYKTVHWTSSDETIATVNEKGEIVGVAPGKVKITATSDEPVAANGKAKAAVCQVTVIQPVLDIVLEVDGKNQAADKLVLKAKIVPENATNKKIKWSSSDTKVASVQNGTVTARADGGKATITVAALDGSGIVASCDVECYFNGSILSIGNYVWKSGQRVIHLVNGSITSNSIALQTSVSEDDTAECTRPQVSSGSLDERMSTVTFGHYEQDGFTEDGKEMIEWYVLENDPETQSVLLISKDILDGHYYNYSFPYPNWVDSDLYKWLNTDFAEAAFTEQERNFIVRQQDNTLISILNLEEAQSLFKTNKEREAKCTHYSTSNKTSPIWWLINLASDSDTIINRSCYYVGRDGSVKTGGTPTNDAWTYSDYGVRPVIRISLDAFQ